MATSTFVITAPLIEGEPVLHNIQYNPRNWDTTKLYLYTGAVLRDLTVEQ